MKLTYIHGSPIRAGAANGVHVIRMCAAFARQGATVTLLVPASSEGIPKHALADHFGTDPLGFDVYELPTIRRGGALHYPLRAAAVSRRLGSDLVYTRAVLPAAVTSLAGIKTVFEAHVPVRATGALARTAFAVASRSSHFRGVVAISYALAAALTADHPALRRILVAPDGADLPPPPPVDEEPATAVIGPIDHAQARSLRVGYVGQLYPGKGMEVIVPLAASRPHYEFHVVGGPAPLVAEWMARPIPSNLLLHGEVAPVDVAHIMNGFDVLLAPYQRTVSGRNGRMDIARWMSPLKIFEYMAARRPMIASDLTVLREVLEHGRNALLCEPEDIAGWGAALDRLAADSALRKRLRDAAWTDVTTRYTWDQRARSLLRFASAQP